MDIKNVKFIRALWGDYRSFINEIPDTPLFDELVYVWGVENMKFLNNLGYETKLVSVNPLIHKDEIEKFNHKIDCFDFASDDFSEFIFLDWDVKLIKNIDDDFLINLNGKSFAAPLYAYPKNFLNLSNISNDQRTNFWLENQIKHMRKFKWDLDELMVLPNAGFFYCSDKDIPKQMRQIVKINSITTLVEEFALFILSNCDLETYIKKYEPSQIFGKPDEDVFILNNIEEECAKKLNTYISNIIKKDIYFKHD
jgi:hypothetical protein